MDLPVYSDIVAAAGRIKGEAVQTPVLESPWLNDAVGGRVFVKPECLQRTGSFKFRGAWNFISQLTPDDVGGGIVAFSSGNHAQGVAAAAAIMGYRATIVMPEDSPAIKLANTRLLGATVVTYDRQSNSRDAVAQKLIEEQGAILVPPFNHKNILAGQGTVGLELADWGKGANIRFGQLLVPAGGGGLIGGCSLAFGERSPKTSVIAVEPEGFDDYGRSLKAGEIVENVKRTGSICDALLTPCGGDITFGVNKDRLAGAVTVSDEEVRAAMRFAFERLKLVVEPGGAVALAALLAGKVKCKDQHTAIVLSGGNVDPELFKSVLGEA